MAARSAISARHVAAATSAIAVGGVAYWEVERWKILQRYEALKVHYHDSGAATRFPFYGRNEHYEIDYMIELGLQQGDQCYARYRLQALPLTNVIALLMWRRLSGRSSGLVAGSPELCDEEATIEVVDGQRLCRHPARPSFWWSPWWPGGEASTATKYSEWLAWPGLVEVHIKPISGQDESGKRRACFTVK
eukprot:TRINITY_DN38785_c0_g1_i1.p1 TRINITY_DN38785_c0_g1~~TRINITY_DN38785_c0_g1_i1.p1  ORF type:complete len:220 (-),score=34.34 TRINITY_DN38785_c0_g1_i1:24-596(-)